MTASASRHAPRIGRPTLTMLVGAALISTSAVFVRWADVPPTVSAFWRMDFAFLMLLPFVWFAARRSRPALASEKAEAIAWLAGIMPGARTLALLAVAALFFALDLFLWHRSILYVGPGLATLLANFQVFLLAAIGVVVLREKVRARFWFAVLLAVVGLWLLVGANWSVFDDRYRSGVWFGLGTAGAYAGYLLTMRRAQSGAKALLPESALAWNCMLCAIFLAMQVLAEGSSFAIPDAKTWAALLAYAAIAQVLGWLLIVRAMPHLPASVVGLLLLLQPSLAFVWDVLLFARPMTAMDVLGVALSLVGIFLGTTRDAGAVQAK